MIVTESFDLTGALQKGMGQFTVLNFANNLTKEKYHIRFGDTEEMLSSSCHDWKKLAIFANIFPCQNWDALSPLYRNSPFLILGSLSDDRNLNYGPDQQAMEDEESHGTFDESDIDNSLK